MSTFAHTILLCLVAGAHVCGQVVSYEATSYPDDENWERRDTLFTADRWLHSSWFVQYAEIVDPGPPQLAEEDYYDYSLAVYSEAKAIFVEWRMVTDGPREGIPAVAPAALVVGGRMGILYHFTIAEDQVRFIDSDLTVFYFDVETGIPHTYRLEIYTGQVYRWLIDGEVALSGFPPGPYPTKDSVIAFGAAAAGGSITAR